MLEPLRPDPPATPPPSETRAHEPGQPAFLPTVPPDAARERRALGVLAVAAVAVMVWITHPVVIGIFLGALNAFTMEPFYEAMRARGRRPVVAAAMAIGISSVVIVAVLAGVSRCSWAGGSRLWERSSPRSLRVARPARSSRRYQTRRVVRASQR